MGGWPGRESGVRGLCKFLWVSECNSREDIIDLHSAWEDKPGPLLTILNPMYLDSLANALSLTLWLSETEGEGEGTDRETEGEKEEQEERKEQTKGRIKHRREEGKEEDGQS